MRFIINGSELYLIEKFFSGGRAKINFCRAFLADAVIFRAVGIILACHINNVIVLKLSNHNMNCM